MFTDIVEHLPLLRTLGARHPRVVELGFRTGVTASNFLSSGNTTVESWDIEDCSRAVTELTRLCPGRFVFHQQDSRQAEPFEHDLLFIDSEHTAVCCAAELALWAPHCTGVIAMHDTETYGKVGDHGGPGLLAGIENFLKAHHEWRTRAVFKNCNGLTVLERA